MEPLAPSLRSRWKYVPFFHSRLKVCSICESFAHRLHWSPSLLFLLPSLILLTMSILKFWTLFCLFRISKFFSPSFSVSQPESHSARYPEIAGMYNSQWVFNNQWRVYIRSIQYYTTKRLVAHIQYCSMFLRTNQINSSKFHGAQ
jgi:hypothetical protein